jgi:dihydroneopterin aldolase
MIYSVYLKNVHFFAYHGLYPEEALNGNVFEVDLSVSYTKQEIITSIEETIDYTALFDILKVQMRVRRELLETLGREICDDIKNQFPQIVCIEIDIRKQNPPIPDFNGKAGFSLLINY